MNPHPHSLRIHPRKRNEEVVRDINIALVRLKKLKLEPARCKDCGNGEVEFAVCEAGSRRHQTSANSPRHSRRPKNTCMDQEIGRLTSSPNTVSTPSRTNTYTCAISPSLAAASARARRISAMRRRRGSSGLGGWTCRRGSKIAESIAGSHIEDFGPEAQWVKAKASKEKRGDLHQAVWSSPCIGVAHPGKCA